MVVLHQYSPSSPHTHTRTPRLSQRRSDRRSVNTEAIFKIILNMINKGALMSVQALNLVCRAVMLIYGRSRVQKAKPEPHSENNNRQGNQWELVSGAGALEAIIRRTQSEKTGCLLV